MNDNETTLQQTALSLRASAESVTITTQLGYDEANLFRREIKSTINKVSEYWKPLKDAAYAQHKAIVAREADMLTPLKEADKAVESSMLTYYREQERIRQELERERQRQEAVARRREEDARRAAEEAARLAAEAAQTQEETGEIDEDTVGILQLAQAEADAASAAVMDVEPVYIPAAPKAFGMSVKRVWRARVFDANLVPISVAGIEIRPIDEKLLNRLAVSSQGKLECPGVEWYQEEQTAVRLS